MKQETGAQRVLIVEDNFLIAMDLSAELEERGFETVGPSATVEEALGLLEREGCDKAVLDLNLGEETSEAIAVTLKARDIPFVVVSGYADHQQPEIFREAPSLTKPVPIEALVGLLEA